MFTQKTILLNDDTKPIKLEYNDNETYFGDTPVAIYDDYKLSLVLTDDCGAVIGDKVFFPKRGDMILFRPNEVHFGRFPKSSAYKFISFFIPTDFFDNVFSDSKSIISPFLDDAEDRINLIRLPETYKGKLITIAEELFEIMKEDSDTHCFDIIAFAKLAEVLSICNKYYSLQKGLPPLPSVPILITKAMQKIEKDFPNFIGLNNLAKHCGCSVTYLTQTFRQYTGKSIHNYLTQRRLEHARRLLQNGATVTEACYQSGFSDCSGFISLFKKNFDITPGKYKKVQGTIN